jgi:hypothetical protein
LSLPPVVRHGLLPTVAFTVTIDVLCYGIPRSEEPKYEDGPAKAKQEAACLRITAQFEIQISHILLPTHNFQSISKRKEWKKKCIEIASFLVSL